MHILADLRLANVSEHCGSDNGEIVVFLFLLDPHRVHDAHHLHTETVAEQGIRFVDNEKAIKFETDDPVFDQPIKTTRSTREDVRDQIEGQNLVLGACATMYSRCSHLGVVFRGAGEVLYVSGKLYAYLAGIADVDDRWYQVFPSPKFARRNSTLFFLRLKRYASSMQAIWMAWDLTGSTAF